MNGLLFPELKPVILDTSATFVDSSVDRPYPWFIVRLPACDLEVQRAMNNTLYCDLPKQGVLRSYNPESAVSYFIGRGLRSMGQPSQTSLILHKLSGLDPRRGLGSYAHVIPDVYEPSGVEYSNRDRRFFRQMAAAEEIARAEGNRPENLLHSVIEATERIKL